MNNRYSDLYQEVAQVTGLTMDAEKLAVFGQRDGFDLLISPLKPENPRILLITVSARRAAGPLSAAEIKRFRAEHRIVFRVEQKGWEIRVTLKNSGKVVRQTRETMVPLLDGLTAFLQQSGFENACQACGTAGATDSCLAGGRYQHLCPACLAGMQQRAAAAVQKPENPLAGAVGALLGSLAGAVCIILLSQLGYVAALSGVVMGVCAIKGYEMLGGALSRKGTAISVVIMLVMTYAADRLDWAIVIARELECDLFTAFRAVGALLEMEALDGSVYWGNLVMLYLFLLLGMVPTVLAGLRAAGEKGVVRPLSR